MPTTLRRMPGLWLGALAALLVLLPGLVAPGRTEASSPTDTITLTSPNNTTIAESDDYATQVLGSPWDMSDANVIYDRHKYSEPTVANGIWSASTSGSASYNDGAWLELQYQGFDQMYSYVGEKDGVNYPISTSRYSHLQIRVNVGAAGQRESVLYYFPAHSGVPLCNSNFVHIAPGWHIYDIDLAAGGSGGNGCWPTVGNVSGLRFDLNPDVPNNAVQIDWARLVPATSSTVNIAWDYTSGSNPNVNLYLRTSPNGPDEMQIASVPASSRSYTWNKAGMAPGTYYIHAEMNGANSVSGALNVNQAPVVRIDAPSQVSGEDFAQASLYTSWEGSNTGQFQYMQDVGDISYTPDYFQGAGTTNDPRLYWLFRDTGHPIDTGRYRYMSIRFYLQRPSGSSDWQYNAGPRMAYARTTAMNWQVTQASLAFYNRWMNLSYDLPNVPLATGSEGWSGTETTLRFDPNENDESGLLPAFFRIDRAHLTSRPIAGQGNLSRAGTVIRWATLRGGGSVDLYWDVDNSGYNGTPIAQNVSLGSGAYSWDTTNMSDGTYWVYAIAHDSYNNFRAYSLVPLVVQHSSPSTIFTDVPTNYWAVNWINDLALRNIINGYVQNDGTVMFRPGNSATRAQLSKMVVLGAGWPLINPPSNYFADVTSTNPLYQFVETAREHGVISGYSCGGPNEPCDPQNRPYFRPGNSVTRAQTAKMIVVSRGWQPCSGCSPTFADVPTSNNLQPYVEAAVQHGIITGYQCGGPGEPCDPQNRPYFRPGNSVTRAQLSKMLSIALTAR